VSAAAPSPLGAYHGESLAVRAHVAVRWRSCPFGAVLAALPARGDVLDVGCGHGVLTLALATTRPDVSVTGVDIDEDKIAVARRAAARVTGGPVRFEVTSGGGGLPGGPGPWDAVVAVDVLYLLPQATQEALVRDLAGALRPGGSLVVKEMDTTPRLKAAWMRVQERLAVRVLRITKGDELAFTDPAPLAAAMRAAGLQVDVRPVDRGYPHPHVLLVGRRPEVTADAEKESNGPPLA
jgi:2-polyprenyl-3-methyl-5-hydroxy-6-metoxy-1,4-benzoquinol methylase